MRIIAGKHKGRKIETLKKMGEVRPTSDFAREAIFNILAHGKLKPDGGSVVEEAIVLDVFCGMGGLGLEALSRGASHVTFVDKSRDALEQIRHNAGRFGELNYCDFMCHDALQLPKARTAHNLIFIDPPYHSGLIAPTLARLQAQGWIAGEAIIIAEHDEKEAPPAIEGFEQLDSRRYGRALVEVLKPR